LVEQLGVFISTKQLVEDTLDLAKVLRKVIPEFDIVCGIPRGGLLPATIIASIFGKPLTTPDLLMENKCWNTSSCAVANRKNKWADEYYCPIPNLERAKILMVDDTSYNSVGQMQRHKLKIVAKFPFSIVYKVPIYVVERTLRTNDLYCKRISMNHWVEKDFMIRRGPYLLGFDMDGVLCEDWNDDPNEDKEKYLSFLENAKPYMIPHYYIDFIITARMEGYRAQTVEWLKKHNVQYGKLIMWTGINKEDRGVMHHSDYKIDKINRLMPPDGIFIESSYSQAKRIFEKTNRQVICTDTMELIGGTDVGFDYHPIFEGFKKSELHPLIVKAQKEEKSSYTHTWLFPR
jgi:adenine/guanine phosphoribosyltransferase-like PRPP-binding protein/uncharacterized HAD superfamily protein